LPIFLTDPWYSPHDHPIPSLSAALARRPRASARFTNPLPTRSSAAPGTLALVQV
jgi:hypothetical protein